MHARMHTYMGGLCSLSDACLSRYMFIQEGSHFISIRVYICIHSIFFWFFLPKQESHKRRYIHTWQTNANASTHAHRQKQCFLIKPCMPQQIHDHPTRPKYIIFVEMFAYIHRFGFFLSFFQKKKIIHPYYLPKKMIIRTWETNAYANMHAHKHTTTRCNTLQHCVFSSFPLF